MLYDGSILTTTRFALFAEIDADLFPFVIPQVIHRLPDCPLNIILRVPFLSLHRVFASLRRGKCGMDVCGRQASSQHGSNCRAVLAALVAVIGIAAGRLK